MAHLLLYGGTFDPIHHGHLITCRRARELLHADTVLLIPARISPHKTHLEQPSTTDQRLAMIRLAIENDPAFALDPRELSREGPSYTVDTLESIAAERPTDRLTLVIGADQLPKFHTWHRIARILELAGVAVMARPGIDLDGGVQATQAALNPPRLTPLATPLIEISATDIRNRVRSDLEITYLVPPPVAHYIQNHRLYGPPTPTA